ncbi:MAG: hypothetical protein JXL97_12750 [Bacteroidales bacterium]|nr:hypothetical protein [Bacteroidales bacterium]
MKKQLLLFISVLLSISAFAQSDTTKSDSPTGWKFGGALPAVAYDSDVGFRYGALGYVYDWGDGSSYPDYVRSIYAEWSRTTKGSGINRIQYDDRAFLGTNLRFFTDLAYLIEQSLDFYGYNGYQSIYNHSYEDVLSADYLSRMYYRLDRRELKGIFDLQIPIKEDKIRGYVGVNISNMVIGSVDVDKLNKGKDPADMLPNQDTLPGLYENYIDWGIIDPREANGGFSTVFKGGLVFDTRDNEAWSSKGIWTEAILFGSPGIGGSSPFLQLSLTHRQYFTIFPKRLTVATRLVYQGTLAGEVPFYLRPYYFNTKEVRDAIGGSKTVRGILRDKVVADSYVFGNVELRWRVIDTKIFKQDFYIALSGFADATMVIKPYDVDLSGVPVNLVNNYFNQDDKDLYKIHLGYGGGIRFGLNENFIVAVDYGLANDPQDGSSGMYIGLGWLF